MIEAHVLIDGRFVEVVRVEGSPPFVLYLHEGLGSARQWRDLPTELGFAGAAYSRFGYGASAPASLPFPLDYMEREGRDFVPRVLDALRIDRAVLLGHSDGGSIAIVTAAAHPDRVLGLVLEAPHVFVEDLSVASIAAAKVAFETADLRARLERHHGANVDVAFRGWNEAWLAPGFRAWNIERYLPAVRAPALVIQGRDDPYGTLAQVEAIARGMTGRCEKLVLPRCGHAPHREAPDAVIAAARRFIAGLPPETRPG